MARRLVVWLIVACLFAPAVRAADTLSSPKTLVLLASNLCWDDLRPDSGRLPNVWALVANGGATALLNTSVAGPATEAAAFLSVGGSERLAAPQTPVASRGEAGLAAPTFAALAMEAYNVPPSSGHGAAREVYLRRYGVPPPAGTAIVHVGLPALLRVQPSPARAAQIGALGDALQAAHQRVATWGDWRAALVGMDRRGIVFGGSVSERVDPARLSDALSTTDVLIVAAPSAAALDHLARAALFLNRVGGVNVLVAAPAPPPPPPAAQSRWTRLGFVVAAGPAVETGGGVLTSPTTRTPGLAANIDLAPTILAWQNASVPAGMGGRALRTVAAASAPALVLSRLDRQVVATRDATIPVLVGYAVWAIGASLAALLALSIGHAPAARAARFALLVAASALVALLPLGVWAPPQPFVYGFAVAGTAVLFALAAAQVGKWRRLSPLGVLLSSAAVVIVIDAMAGTPLVSRALLSGYYLAGIRFYGVGNEYMGLAVGAALTGPLLLATRPASFPPNPPSLGGEDSAGRNVASLVAGQTDDVGQATEPGQTHSSPPKLGGLGGKLAGRGGSKFGGVAGAALLWLATLLAIGLPWWGADAGGALAAIVTFVVAAFAARTVRLRARHIALAFALAFVVVAALAALDRAQPSERQSHAGAAVAAGQARGTQALGEIAARKVAMNVRLALTPWTLAALAGLAPIWWALGRGPLGARAQATLAARPPFKNILLPAAGWGAFAALVFNDSGVVAALLLLAPPTVAVIDQMLCDSLP